MGDMGYFECTAGCGYMSEAMYAGAGMSAIHEIKRCAVCGELANVLAARVNGGEVVEASGRGRCPECRSQRLRPAPDAEAAVAGDETHAEAGTVPCPRCGARARWSSTGIWD